MPMPNLPTFVTPTTRDAIFSSLGMEPELSLSATVTGETVTVQFIAVDEDGRLIRSSGTDVIHTIAIPVQDS